MVLKLRKYLPSHWWQALSPEEIEQEELIQAWQNPDKVEYVGLLAYYSLMMKGYVEGKDHAREAVAIKGSDPAPDLGILEDLKAEYRYYLDVIKESASHKEAAEKLHVTPERVAGILREIRDRFPNWTH